MPLVVRPNQMGEGPWLDRLFPIHLPEISSPRRPRERLPWMACMARLSARPIDPEMVSSELTLLWWQDAMELPLPQEIERVAAGLEWVGAAEDVDLP
jgi:hypothetical protein